MKIAGVFWLIANISSGLSWSTVCLHSSYGLVGVASSGVCSECGPTTPSVPVFVQSSYVTLAYPSIYNIQEWIKKST